MLLDQLHGTNQKLIGIPMKLDSVPLFANMFLLYHEHKWIEKNLKSDIG